MIALRWLLACGESPDKAPPATPTSDADTDTDADGDADTDTDTDACAPEGAPEAPLRLLTRTQVDRSVQGLVGVVGTTRQRLPADPTVHGFEGAASTVAVSQLHADGYLRSAEDATAGVDWAALLPCDPAAGDRSCALAFVDELGRRAFRRPLGADERDVFLALYDEAVVDTDFATTMAMVVQVMLQSPQFLYRLELGEPGAAGAAVALTPHELATRLALTFWDEGPDEALLAAADADTLRDPAVLEAQIDRLLADPRARDSLGRWAEQWLDLRRLDAEPKDATAFPTWSPALADAVREETRRFASDVVFDGEGTLDALLTSRVAWVDGPLAELYGVAGPADPDDWVRVELPADERAGLLTRAGFLAAAAHSNQTSVVHRGLVVYEQVYCGVQPPPPGDLDITLPPLDDSLSTRERLARHTQDPLCSGCHQRLDPVGFGFEHYDPIGAWRDTEGDGVPIDASGVLVYGDAAGPFDGALELSALLADDAGVRSCFVTQWFRSAWGREPGPADTCSVEALEEAFADGDVLELLRALPTTDAFGQRPAVTP